MLRIAVSELLEQWLQGRVVGRPLTWRTLLLAMVQTGQCTSVAQQVWTVLSKEDKDRCNIP